MEHRDLILTRTSNQDAKNRLIISLGELANTSDHRDYYGQAIRLIGGLEPSYVMASVLSARYSREQISEILGLTLNTVTQYRKNTIQHIRNSIDNDVYCPSVAVLPYFMGLVNIDAFTKTLDKL